MKKLSIIVITVTLCFVSLSCRKAPAPAPDNIANAVQVIQDYADSFEGLSVSEAKKRVSTSIVNEEDWIEEGIINGKIISAQYKGYALMLMCHDGRVVTASVQFLSDEE